MAHRPEWFPQVGTNDAGILGLASDIVGNVRGSCDLCYGSRERHDLYIRALEWVVETWDDNYSCGREGDKEFDETILKLVKIALEMDKKDQERIKRYKDSGHFNRSSA